VNGDSRTVSEMFLKVFVMVALKSTLVLHCRERHVIKSVRHGGAREHYSVGYYSVGYYSGAREQIHYSPTLSAP